MLAERTRLFPSSGTARARAAAKAAKEAGKEIIDLSAGEIWTMPSDHVLAGAIEAVQRGENRYTETLGIPALRKIIAERLSHETGAGWGTEHIAVTAGAKQALFNAAMVLLNVGDEVIIPSPYWTTFPAQVRIAGGVPVFIDTRTSDFMPTPDALHAAITPRTRAIIINTPNNPTGAVYSASLLAAIAELAERHDFWIIFDECYASFVHAPLAHEHIVTVAPTARSRTLVVNAFSKQLALTGWRLGYLAGPPDVITAVGALQSHTTSNPNVIAQHGVLTHLESGDRAFLDGLQKRLVEARALGLAQLGELDDVPRPRAAGGFYFYLDLEHLLKRRENGAATNADDVAHYLLAEAGVASVSGTAFGDPYGLRLSYGVPADMLSDGLERLVRALHTYKR